MKQVVIVGRPNAGKSALFNRLAQRRLAIVHDQPGITRDRISTKVSIGEKTFQLWDTGGIGGAGETELAEDVRAAAERAIAESDLLLFVVDGKSGLNPLDHELARLLRRTGKPVLLVINKIDDPRHESLAAEFFALGLADPHLVSAAHGRGTAELIETITRSLAPGDDISEASTPPLKIAIVGRPNAGKSSLINALLRDRRAIVSEIPGTTRDAVDVSYERSGKRYLLIDTAGIRARSKHSSSVEVFSVMRAEQSIERADLCLLVVDAVAGAKAQDRRIAGLMQKARKPSLIVLNKWDLVRPARESSAAKRNLMESARAELFFSAYAPILLVSAATREHVDRILPAIERVRRASQVHLGTGKLNRALRAAFASNPPPMIGGQRLKLFYATQAASDVARPISPPEIVLFVNSPRLLAPTFARFLEARIRELQPYEGLPLLLKARARSEERGR